MRTNLERSLNPASLPPVFFFLALLDSSPSLSAGRPASSSRSIIYFASDAPTFMCPIMSPKAARDNLRSAPANLEPYAYQELADSQDIRLATLLPGKRGDTIRIHIHHTPLTQVSTPPEVRTILSPKALQATLPTDWKAHETAEGRIVFVKWFDKEAIDEEEIYVTWDHPVPGVDPSLYRRDPEPIEGSAIAPPSKYEALSYTWGRTGRDELIYIVPGPGQLQGRNTVLAVRENLAAALRHLRQPDKPRVLWVDQICINQADTLERGKQVSRMAEIYTLAWRVVVWLGAGQKHKDGGGSDAAMDALISLGCEVQLTLDHYIIPTPGGKHPSWSRRDTTPPIRAKTLIAIGRLLSRPWFERLWIVQEIFCANRRAILQCGTRIANWLVFHRALTTLSSKRQIPNYISTTKIFSNVNLTHDKLEVNHGLLSRVLSRGGGRKCSDKRDRVYGLFALLSPAFQSTVRPPSYNTSVKDVFVDVTLAHIHHVRRLELLNHCNLQYRIADDAPSWVPSFATAILFNNYPQFAAGYSECSHIVMGANLLQVLGVRCAVIKRTASPRIGATLSEIMAKLAFETRAGQESDSQSRLPRGSLSWELLARTIASNLLDDRFPNQGFPSLDRWLLRLSTLDTIKSTGGRKQKRKSDSLDPFVEEVARSSLEGLFLVTEEGSLGLGLSNARQDDIVVVLLGCDSPMILRPGKEPGQFLVVSKCYFIDLEDANALLGPLPGEGRWRTAVLRDSETGGVAAQFLDSATGLRTDEDPRLPPLPPPWEAVDNVAAAKRLERTLDDPFVFRRFRNKETGEVVNSDPRMLPDALRARGVPLEFFTLA
ncbi:hypothetical protein MAPG_07059 [Magnaporthiopsis poae ATCC 64411]|uniref:Heterokaryon incompatibility domain-containing protein n=1 Tax=Magnaporthiopsis poae (strain ATCC 64411 / 73-15) TaxID=644358 RepID=A0A0C4E3P4_MAGP6|nr:hypothetical protein MAPG_07059 [Magnaporthiopsis poae ATCC 64411]